MKKEYIMRYQKKQPKHFLNLFSIGMLAIIIGCSMAIYDYQHVLENPVDGVLILEYHKINDEDTDTYTVTTHDFKKQLDVLEQLGYKTISLREFLRAKKGLEQIPAKSLVITLDDGYEDSYSRVLPILEQRGAKATVFMVSNLIGKKGYLTWDMLKDMQNRSIEIGGHTANHLPLTKLNDLNITKEVELSKLLMEWNGIKTIYTFSYPNGEHNKRVARILKDKEYLAAVGGETGLNDFQTDVYYLKRVNIPRPYFGILEFKLRLWRAYVFYRLSNVHIL